MIASLDGLVAAALAGVWLVCVVVMIGLARRALRAPPDDARPDEEASHHG